MLGTLVFKNLIQRPLRYLLTGAAIAFGVAAVTAVFIFTDGLRDTFDELAGNIESGYDVSIQTDAPFGDGLDAEAVPVSVLDAVSGVDGVLAVQPRIIEFGVVAVDGNDDPVLASGPNIGLNWEGRTPNPRLFLVEGREPTARGEFAIDIEAFDGAEFEVGGTYRVLTPKGSESFELAGVFSYADPEQSATVGAVIVAFEEATALELLNGNEGYDDITLVSDGDTEGLVERLGPVLAAEGDNLVAISQAELVAEAEDAFGQILGIFQTVLLVFAAIILLVSAFLIFNVFTITLGQRIKELGLLRSIGALGNQVTAMMLGEALVLGVVATIAGLPAGWVLARILRLGLSKLGFPGDTGLPIRPLTIVWAILVGVVVTLLAAVWPSIRARRVAPMAALRDDFSNASLDTDPNPLLGVASLVAAVVVTLVAFRLDGWLPRLTLPLLGGLLLYLGLRWMSTRSEFVAQLGMLLGGVLLLTIVRFGDFGLGETFGLLGAGAILTILGASLVSGAIASPAARAIGYPVPTALIVGLIGVVLALAFVGSIIGAIYLVATGAYAGILLPIPGVLAGIGGFALLRTAYGAFGLTGRLARDNAARNPQRTATTATALMIGIALVTAVTVIGDSIKSSVTNALDSAITSDWLVTGPQSGPQGLPFSTDVADRLREVDEVEEVLAFRFSFAGFASVQGASADEVEAALPRLFAALGSQDDDPGALSALEDELGLTRVSIDDVLSVDFDSVDSHVNPDFVERVPVESGTKNGIWLEDSVAADRDLAIGDRFVAVFLNGAVEELTVTGIYTDGFIFGDRVIDDELWVRHLPSDTDDFVTVSTAADADPELVRAALEGAILDDYPTIEVQDKSEFAADAEAQINQTLATVNILLLLSAGIAILGIAIALSLSVFERTREIGLLRAVGTTRQQTRWMVRWEGVIVAAFGGIVGVLIGVGLGVLATQKMPEFLVNATTVPVPSLISYVIVAAIVGLGAGAFPAWIAGRMNVLEAIAND